MGEPTITELLRSTMEGILRILRDLEERVTRLEGRKTDPPTTSDRPLP